MKYVIHYQWTVAIVHDTFYSDKKKVVARQLQNLTEMRITSHLQIKMSGEQCRSSPETAARTIPLDSPNWNAYAERRLGGGASCLTKQRLFSLLSVCQENCSALSFFFMESLEVRNGIRGGRVLTDDYGEYYHALPQRIILSILNNANHEKNHSSPF